MVPPGAANTEMIVRACGNEEMLAEAPSRHHRHSLEIESPIWPGERTAPVSPDHLCPRLRGTQSEIEETVADPYMGFNVGSTKARLAWTGDVRRFYFESPLVRLMSDYEYEDVFVEGDDWLAAEHDRAATCPTGGSSSTVITTKRRRISATARARRRSSISRRASAT